MSRKPVKPEVVHRILCQRGNFIGGFVPLSRAVWVNDWPLLIMLVSLEQDFRMRNSGFSLIELLVALAILAIVSAIAVPIYSQFSDRTYRSQAMSDLLNCAQGLERFASINFTYENAADTDADGVGDADAGVIALQICDPVSVRENRYVVTVNGDDTGFNLTATPQGNLADDGIVTYSSAGVRGWDRDGNDAISTAEETWED
jgi:type IV pilus assembly protein PilE